MPAKPRRTTSARPPIGDKLDHIIRQNDLILANQEHQRNLTTTMEKNLMGTAADVVAKIQAKDTVIASIEAMTNELVALVRAGKTDPAKLDEALALLDGQYGRLDQAVIKGTAAENETPAG
jgi:peptidoglycan hydrolase CwlO-like protein